MPSQQESSAGDRERQERLLREIRDLADSVRQLAMRPADRPPRPDDRRTAAVRTAQFSYRMLSVLMKRRDDRKYGEPELTWPVLKATQAGNQVTFEGDLRGATVADVYVKTAVKSGVPIEDRQITVGQGEQPDFVVLHAPKHDEPVAVPVAVAFPVRSSRQGPY